MRGPTNRICKGISSGEDPLSFLALFLGEFTTWRAAVCLIIAVPVYPRTYPPGLNHIHSMSILHRDIKPANVFLTKSLKVIKIGDFGIAKRLGEHDDLANTVVGTPYYMRWGGGRWNLNSLAFCVCIWRSID